MPGTPLEVRFIGLPTIDILQDALQQQLSGFETA
jgi:hypothetical protein